MGHYVFEPWGGEAGMCELTCEGFGFVDCKTSAMGAPCGREFRSERIQEVYGCVHGKPVGVGDVSEDVVDWRNSHFFHLVKRNGVLSVVKDGWAKEDQDGFDACRCGMLNAGDIKELNVDAVVNIDGVGG